MVCGAGSSSHVDDAGSRAGARSSRHSMSRAGKSTTASSRGSKSGTSVASSDDASSHRGSRSGRSGKTGNSAYKNSKRMSYAVLWGEDTCGQLGMRGLQGARSPTLLRDMAVSSTSVKAVAASADCSAFVTDKGQLFMCGGGARGKLGLKHTNNARSPLQVHALSAESVTTVSLGVNHTLCLTISGKVYAWGDATWGNTGMVSEADCLEPTEIKNLSNKDITSVVAGHYHSFAITMEGQLFAWGKNSNGQLGLGYPNQCEPSPKKVEFNMGQVQSVAGGGNHSVIIASVSAPNVYTFGMNANGQLGLNDTVDRCDPRPVVKLEDRLIVSADCGTCHTAVVGIQGDVIVWGNGRSGQLGTYEGIDADVIEPQQLPPFCADRVTAVKCGDEITIAITETRRVFMWGTESTMGLGSTAARDATNPTGILATGALTRTHTQDQLLALMYACARARNQAQPGATRRNQAQPRTRAHETELVLAIQSCSMFLIISSLPVAVKYL